MKKEYCKPDVFFEDFTMSTNIAAGCEEKPFGNTDMCGVKWSKGQILFSDIPGTICTKKVIDGSSEANGLCYHNPYDSYNVFYS